MISTPELIRTQILALVKEYHTARYSLLQIILIIFVTVLAVIVIFYYLTREEPRETMSYRNTKIIVGLVIHKKERIPFSIFSRGGSARGRL